MTKVLILGGGLGGISAAWALSRTDALRAQFQVTLVQPGWRLGGKCASGREAGTGRIHEHGLHMFMGWYEHAFYMLREVYGAWPNAAGRAFPLAQDAFLPLRELTFGRPGTQDFWKLPFPQHAGFPGDSPDGRSASDVFSLAGDMIAGLHNRLHNAPPAQPSAGAAPLAPPLTILLGLLDGLTTLVTRIGPPSKQAYEARVLVDICTAALRGMISGGVASNGHEVLNDKDFRQWLGEHGASRETMDSALIKALYDLAFAYPSGVETDPQMEAGSMLHVALRMAVGYRDAPVYRMRAGMGDVVFSPLYEVLKGRGVKFRFFHRAKGLTLTPDERGIATVVLQRQVDLAPGVVEYDPLIDCPVSGKELKAWPAMPDWSQLSVATPTADFAERLEMGGPEVLTETLSAGVDFDEVVLAIPLGGDLGDTLAGANAHWAAMRGSMKTVATQAAQLWMLPSLPGMGWAYGPTVLAAFVPPFSDWADMSHLLPMEGPGGAGAPNGLIYLCGVATDTASPADVANGLSDWLDAHCLSMWPATAEPRGFRYSMLEGGSLDTQYIRLNNEGSERYVLSVPGSSATRIPPGETGFVNLSVAGDWVLGEINGGCAEGAITAGHDAADALILRITGTARPPYPAVP